MAPVTSSFSGSLSPGLSAQRTKSRTPEGLKAGPQGGCQEVRAQGAPITSSLLYSRSDDGGAEVRSAGRWYHPTSTPTHIFAKLTISSTRHEQSTSNGCFSWGIIKKLFYILIDAFWSFSSHFWRLPTLSYFTRYEVDLFVLWQTLWWIWNQGQI